MLGFLGDDVGNLNIQYWFLFWYVCALSRTEPWLLLCWCLRSLASSAGTSRYIFGYLIVSQKQTLLEKSLEYVLGKKSPCQLARPVTMDTDTIKTLATTTKETYEILDQ
jgi:hypothetical protein